MLRGNRGQNDLEDDFDLFGSGDDLDSVSLDSFLDDDDDFLSAVEEKPARKSSRPRRARAVRRVSLIGGCLQVFLIALLSLILFLALGFGIAVAARSIGLVSVDTATPAAELPTPFPTSTPVPPTENAAVAVEPTNEPTCVEMADWWNAQATVYASFSGLSVSNPPDQLPPLIQRMRIWRDNAAAIPAAPCVESARGVLLNAYDFLIGAFESLNSGDVNAANSRSLMALGALSDLYPALWNAGVATEDSPVAAGIAGGSGFDCGASAWYDAAKLQREAFREAYQGLDLRTQPPNVIRQTLNTMTAVRANVDALETPECAATLERLMLDMMSSTIDSVQQGLSGNVAASAESLLDARRAELMLDSWIQWLGFVP